MWLRGGDIHKKFSHKNVCARFLLNREGPQQLDLQRWIDKTVAEWKEQPVWTDPFEVEVTPDLIGLARGRSVEKKKALLNSLCIDHLMLAQDELWGISQTRTRSWLMCQVMEHVRLTYSSRNQACSTTCLCSTPACSGMHYEDLCIPFFQKWNDRSPINRACGVK